MKPIQIIDIESYSYNRVKYTNHSVRNINYWLLGRGSLYPTPMVAKTRTNHQLAIL